MKLIVKNGDFGKESDDDMNNETTSKSNTFKWLEDKDIKSLTDEMLIEKVKSTSNTLKLCKLYQMNVKGDYGKQKIASLRVDFISHQLEMLKRECCERGIRLNS